MSVELKIIIKDEEGKKLSMPFLIYEDITFKEDDKVIADCVKQAVEEFKGEPDEIKIIATMIIR